MPSHVPNDLRRLLEPVQLLVLDVDGVLTDGTLVYTGEGEVSKRFNVRDGLVIRLLPEAGVLVAVLTGRRTDAVAKRCAELGVREDLVIQGSRDKAADLDQLMSALELSEHQVAAMGDDLPDLPVLTRVGFAACPADAAPEVIAACQVVCGAPGGRGAVREVGELILKAKGQWIELVGRWTMPGETRTQEEDR